MTRRPSLLAAASVLALLAGCTSTDTPTTTTTTPPSTGQLSSVDQYRDRPCSLLSAAQWTQLGFEGEGQETVAGTCIWKKTQPNRGFTLEFYSRPNPLEITCRAVEGEVVESVTVAGFPAQRCARNSGRDCEMAFDTRQDQKILIGVGGENEADWCAKASAAVGYIVHNLGG